MNAWVSAAEELPEPDHTKRFDVFVRAHKNSGSLIPARVVELAIRLPDGWKGPNGKTFKKHVKYWRAHDSVPQPWKYAEHPADLTRPPGYSRPRKRKPRICDECLPCAEAKGVVPHGSGAL